MRLKIKTTVDITINAGMLVTKKTKIIGELIKIEIGNNFNQYNIHYNYRDEDNNLIKQDIYTLSDKNIDDQYDLIKKLLPLDYDTLNEREKTYNKYLIAFKFIMANTFLIDYDQIEEMKE